MRNEMLWVMCIAGLAVVTNVEAKTDHVGEDPEALMNVTQLLTSKGYPCQNYDVHTKDGYILSVQRVPHGKNVQYPDPKRPVVLAMHGLLQSSSSWVENLVNESIGFLLADAGFEVWLGNVRGNTYGRRHERLTPDMKEFWQFSWDEMALYDLPAIIEKVLEISGVDQIYYIGFSQGTQIAFAMFSRDQKLASKVKLFVGLAPVAYLGNLKSPVRKLAPYSKDIGFLFQLFGEYEFLPSTKLIRWLGEDFCGHELPDIICENIIFVLGGYDTAQMNSTRIPVYIGHSPAGTSVQNIIHYAQSVQSGKFQMFDFGAEGNMNKYNQSTAPEYTLKTVNTPVALYTGNNDWLADPADVNIMIPQLKNIVRHKVIPPWEHLDFIWGMDSPTVCYQDIITLLKTTSNLT